MLVWDIDSDTENGHNGNNINISAGEPGKEMAGLSAGEREVGGGKRTKRKIETMNSTDVQWAYQYNNINIGRKRENQKRNVGFKRR